MQSPVPSHPNDPPRPGSSRIPFNRLQPVGRALEYVAQAAASQSLAGDGPFSRRCHDLIRRELGVPAVYLTTSCTHALEMAALLLDLQPGDEVIVPAFTFPSSAGAFVLRGAVPVFCDIRNDTLNLDETLLPALVTPRTRAIVPVHYAGIGCDMDAIGRVAARHGLAVIEDNAHGLFGRYRGRWLGTLGTMACLSFHESKNITCGEGGALLLNEAGLNSRAEIVREKGTNRSRFFRGEVDRYTWVEAGSSYLLSDVLAAYLCGQLELWPEIQAARRRVFATYCNALAPHAAALGFQVPTVPAECEPAYHLFYLLLRDAPVREHLIAALRARSIRAISHYQPLHLSQAGRRFGRHLGCPVTESICDRVLRLPLYPALRADEQEEIIDVVLTALTQESRG